MMLSRYDDSRTLVILQIDHSEVAGYLTSFWGNKEFQAPQPLNSVIVGAGGHDSAWWDWEVRPTLKQGAQIDYYRSNEVLGQLWLDMTNGWMERVAKRDVYAAYLMSMHHEGLLTGGFGVLPHMPDRREEGVVSQFASDQHAFRTRLREEIRRSPYEKYMVDDCLWRNYKLVQVFDQFAQIICNRYPFNSTERRTGPSLTLRNIPVALGKDDTTITIEPVNETEAIVRPWPFGKDPLVITVPGRLVPSKEYTDEEQYVTDFWQADRVTIVRTLKSA